MIQGLTSFLMLTLDRAELTWTTLQQNFKLAGTDNIELLVADNGSKDRRIVDLISSHPKLSYHRVNSKNEGVAHSFNQLFIRSKGEYIAFLGNDIVMFPNWVTTMIEHLNKVPNSGIAGVNWGHSGLPPVSEKFGVKAHYLTPILDKVFGAWVVRRSVIEHLGLFHEGFGPYSMEDSDFNNRVNRAGYNSFYVHGYRSNHVGVGQHDSGEYRKMKDESMRKNVAILGERMKNYDRDGLIEPLPPERPPL